MYSKTGTILDAICEKKVEEIAAITVHDFQIWKDRIKNLPKNESTKFSISITQKKPGIIAEIKKASPSEGIIRKDIDISGIALSYLKNGASAISVVTDKQFFQGDINWISEVNKAVLLPVIRKDFVIDEKQVYESKAAGADAMLLIAGILEESKLKELYGLCYELGMESLVEVHTLQELEKALRIGAEIIGINNRNLKSFGVDNSTFSSIANHIPDNKIVVAESGIHSREDLLYMKNANADAVLIGTHFMHATDPGQALAELISGIQ
ncbi:MAG TPA: indole-3-glycerol phosphate synthase TrpC [Bacteroidia bacterium]|jgi:indole-3-glycerol phosphate synthase|nr:indole-3-glycerol phosphate synthase TrpC [Bacteroidia bacterium]